MENRKQFTMYESIYKALQKIRNKKDRADAYDAICAYALYNQEPDLNSISDAVAISFKDVFPELQKERRLSAEGRRSSEYKMWRSTVFERDNYTCQICKRRGCRINAHHIKSYAYHHNLRYAVSNGITLCERCHKMVHQLIRKGLISG